MKSPENINTINEERQRQDLELIQRTLAGNQDAFGELVGYYQQAIYRYSLSILSRNIQDAEDNTSETFFKAYKNLASFKPTHKFSSWLYRIAHNESVSIIRSKSGFFSIDIADLWFVPAEEKNDSILSKTDIDEILNQLKSTDRDVLVLFYLEEKSLKEMGDILNLTENTIAQKLTRARKRAKILIKKLQQNSTEI